MASVEAWVSTLVGSVSYGVGAYLVVKYVLPLVREVLDDVVKYRKGVGSFVKLLEILVYVTAATGIIGMFVALGETVPGYASFAKPAIEIFSNILPTLRLLIIGVGILLVVERIKLK